MIRILCFLVGMVIIFLLSNKANAELSVHTAGVHIGSKHFPQNNWNNSNPGVYLRGTINSAGMFDGDYVVGTYYNSERRQSAYLGYVYPVTDNVDVVLGVISGYNRMAVLPMVVPSVHVPLVDGWNARLSFLPKVERNGSNVVHLSVERKF